MIFFFQAADKIPPFHQDLTLAQREHLICTDTGKYESVGGGRLYI